jgi:hypothetical protein
MGLERWVGFLVGAAVLLLVVILLLDEAYKAVGAERRAQGEQRDADHEDAEREHSRVLNRLKADLHLELEKAEVERDKANERATSRAQWAENLAREVRAERDRERDLRLAAEGEAAGLRDEIERLKYTAQLQHRAVMRWASENGVPPPPVIS